MMFALLLNTNSAKTDSRHLGWYKILDKFNRMTRQGKIKCRSFVLQKPGLRNTKYTKFMLQDGQ